MRLLSVFLVSLAVVVFFQKMEGAYESEFGSHPDEAAHYVTGLMIRDYLAGGLHGSPMAYADNYYKHYPKVGLGIWPPVFYLAQSAWTLVFQASRTSLLLLMAVLTALLLTTLYHALREEAGSEMAAAGTLLFAALPLVQQYSGMIMAEVPVALLMFGAAILFGRFLDRGRAADAAGFGLCAALAILTKGTGIALAPMAALAILFTRKFSVLKRPALWLSGLLAVVLAGPWTWVFRNQGRGGWEEASVSWHFTRQALVYYPWKLAIALGILLAVLALAGILTSLFKTPVRPGKMASCGALVLSVLLFQAVIPVGQEARHLFPAIPAMILFAITGADWLLRACKPDIGPTGKSLVGAAFLAVFFLMPGILARNAAPIGFGSLGEHLGLSPFRIAHKGFTGFGPLAAGLSSDPANRKAVFLVSSDARGEGMFISEMAMLDGNRPGRVIQRASKILSGSTWSGSGYQNYFETQEAVLKLLMGSPIQVVVIDSAVPNAKPHHLLLQATVEGHPDQFKRIGEYPVFREGVRQSELVTAYRIVRG